MLLFKYKIKKETYCILTSIVDPISLSEIKALYWRRWQVELDIRKFKYDILYDKIRSKNHNSLLLDIECIRFISIISAIIEYIGNHKNNNHKKKIHSKNCLSLLFSRLLKLFIYQKDNSINEIAKIIGIIFDTVVEVIANRTNIRIRISPSTKWNANGNRYGNKGIT